MQLSKQIVLSLATAALIGAFDASAALEEPKIGTTAPDFSVSDHKGKTHHLSDYKGKWVVLEWKNHGCPFVAKHYDSGNMQKLQKTYTAKGVTWLSIISSAEGKQGFATKDQVAKDLVKYKAAPTAVLLDTDGKVGKMYGAKTTPAMYVINPKGLLVYSGAIDDKPTTELSDVNTAKNYVAAALDEAMAGKKVTTASTKSYGCSVKYVN